MTSSERSERWWIPADFMYGSEEEDCGKIWLVRGSTPAMHEAWLQFIMQILHLTGQHEPGHQIVVSVAKLTEFQIQCALDDMQRRGWTVHLKGNEMSIRSKAYSADTKR